MSNHLPPAGAEFPCTALALNSRLEYEGGTVSLGLRGGMKYIVTEDPEDPQNGVLLQLAGFRMATDDSDRDRVVLEQADTEAEPKSTLRLTQRFPPRYEQRDCYGIKATVELRSRGDAPTVLVSKEPMVTVARLSQFPPRGDLYELAAPVDLVRTWDLDTVVGRLTSFPAKRGSL